jgi:FkbM family methyltransferase
LASAKYNPKEVIACEPNDESFKLLEENIKINNFSNLMPIKKAISDKCALIRLALNSDPNKCSTEKNVPTNFADVEAITLEALFQKFKIPHCNLLKLDCEGGEYNIIMKSPDVIINVIDKIVLEYHDGVTCYNHKDLVRFLNSKGFNTAVLPNKVHNDLGYLYAQRI